MGVVVELERYRQEVAKQRGRRCTDCGSLCLDRRQWGKSLICEGCEAKLLAAGPIVAPGGTGNSSG